MSFPGNMLIIILQIFRHNKYYQPYKINPKTDINEELIAHDELCGIVWHEGPSTYSGHYIHRM